MTFNNEKDIEEHNNHLIKVYRILNELPKEEILLIIGWILKMKKLSVQKYLNIVKTDLLIQIRI